MRDRVGRRPGVSRAIFSTCVDRLACVRSSDAESGSWTLTMQLALVLLRDEAGRGAA